MSAFSNMLRAIAFIAMFATAGAASAADAPPAYVKAVMVQISGKVVYPHMAKLRHQEGAVTLAVTIDGSGGLTNVAVEESSGAESLDTAAMEAAKAAAPYPAPPEAGTVVHGKVGFKLD